MELHQSSYSVCQVSWIRVFACLSGSSCSPTTTWRRGDVDLCTLRWCNCTRCVADTSKCLKSSLQLDRMSLHVLRFYDSERNKPWTHSPMLCTTSFLYITDTVDITAIVFFLNVKRFALSSNELLIDAARWARNFPLHLPANTWTSTIDRNNIIFQRH